jgi:hypothetical protein
MFSYGQSAWQTRGGLLMSVEEWRGDEDLEIGTINKIRDALDVDFAWMKYPQGITLPLESLYIILSAINNLDRGNQ